MGLIEWNGTLMTGRGRTGTLYALTCVGPGWAVAVDGDVICAASDAASAFARIEDLEALKHVVCGRQGELDFSGLQRASRIAAEMKEASDAIAASESLPPDETLAAEAYSEHLGDLIAAIAAEQGRRRVAAPLNQAH